MGVNRSEQMLDKQLINRLGAVENELRALKQVQKLGGDNIVVTASNVASSVTPLAAGDTTWFTVTVTPNPARLTLWDFRYSIFIDGQAISLQQLLPNGINVAGALAKKFQINYIPDWATSSDSTGVRIYFIGITNNDSSQHTVAFEAVAYAIKTSTS